MVHESKHLNMRMCLYVVYDYKNYKRVFQMSVSFRKVLYTMYIRYLAVDGDLEKSGMTVNEIADIIGDDTTPNGVKATVNRGIGHNQTRRLRKDRKGFQPQVWALSKYGVQYCAKIDTYYDYETDTVIQALKDKAK